MIKCKIKGGIVTLSPTHPLTRRQICGENRRAERNVDVWSSVDLRTAHPWSHLLSPISDNANWSVCGLSSRPTVALLPQVRL